MSELRPAAGGSTGSTGRARREGAEGAKAGAAAAADALRARADRGGDLGARDRRSRARAPAGRGLERRRDAGRAPAGARRAADAVASLGDRLRTGAEFSTPQPPEVGRWVGMGEAVQPRLIGTGAAANGLGRPAAA